MEHRYLFTQAGIIDGIRPAAPASRCAVMAKDEAGNIEVWVVKTA